MLKRIIRRSLCLSIARPIVDRTSCRNASRFTSRTPVAIVNEHELYEPEESTEVLPKSPRRPEKRSVPKNVENQVPQAERSRFKTLKENDNLISSLMLKVKSRKARGKNNLVLLEGKRLMVDAIETGIKSKVIFFSRLSDLDSLPISEDTELYRVPYRSIQLWSNLTTSPGIIGIFEHPDTLDIKPADNALPLTIICDNVREPGNLGGILRTAAGVGCERLILMKGCVDLWEPKVLRTASGAHFRLPIQNLQLWDNLSSLITMDSQVFLTDSQTIFTPDGLITSPDVETRMKETDPTKSEGVSPNDLKGRDKRVAMKDFVTQFPVAPYYSVDFTKKEVVLVVTGETEGLSKEACGFFKERDCIRVNIPLTNGVDSLNTGTAFGIVAFEIRRQFAKKIEEID